MTQLNHKVRLLLPLLLLMGFLSGKAQYTLDEIGVNLGGGYVTANSVAVDLGGFGLHTNLFYGHYFCGKTYGIHVQGGFNYNNLSTSNGDGAFGDGTGAMTINQLQFEGAGFFKIKLKDYHRPKEWAVFFGPKFSVPLIQNYSSEMGSGKLSDIAGTPFIVPAAHLSVQFRRPAPEKKSWFFQPGIEYSLYDDFSTPQNSFSRLYLFLNFGYAFFDKRG